MLSWLIMHITQWLTLLSLFPSLLRDSQSDPCFSGKLTFSIITIKSFNHTIKSYKVLYLITLGMDNEMAPAF